MSKEKGGQQDIPTLQRITPREVQDIKNMFNLLCVDHSNRINQYLAVKLYRNLGTREDSKDV
jgi:Ca2+-binding EF-hand superfamily protein